MNRKASIILLLLGVLFLGIAIGRYVEEYLTVERWQQEGLAAWASYTVSVWQDWWKAATWEHALDCWMGVTQNVLSAITGLSTIAGSITLWTNRPSRGEA